MDRETTAIVTAIIVAGSALFGAILTTFTSQYLENKRWRRRRAQQRLHDQSKAYAQLYAFYLQSRAIMMQPKAQADEDLEDLFKTIGPDFCLASLSSPKGVLDLAEHTGRVLGSLSAAKAREEDLNPHLKEFDESFKQLKDHMRKDLETLQAQL